MGYVGYSHRWKTTQTHTVCITSVCCVYSAWYCRKYSDRQPNMRETEQTQGSAGRRFNSGSRPDRKKVGDETFKSIRCVCDTQYAGAQCAGLLCISVHVAAC